MSFVALCVCFYNIYIISNPQIALFVSRSDLCGWFTVSSTQTVSLHHVGGHGPQPGQVVSFHMLKYESVEQFMSLHFMDVSRPKPPN